MVYILKVLIKDYPYRNNSRYLKGYAGNCLPVDARCFQSNKRSCILSFDMQQHFIRTQRNQGLHRRHLAGGSNLKML